MEDIRLGVFHLFFLHAELFFTRVFREIQGNFGKELDKKR